MHEKESWGAIFATKEAHSTQRGQPPRMHGPGLWRYEQKEQRVTSVPMSGVNCDLWCPGWDSKDLGGTTVIMGKTSPSLPFLRMAACLCACICAYVSVCVRMAACMCAHMCSSFYAIGVSAQLPLALPEMCLLRCLWLS